MGVFRGLWGVSTSAIVSSCLTWLRVSGYGLAWEWLSLYLSFWEPEAGATFWKKYKLQGIYGRGLVAFFWGP